jgi:hypothetical protein
MTEEELNRRLYAILEPDGCWHYFEDINASICGTCKGAFLMPYAANPTYSHSDEIAALMMERGLWMKFKNWYWQVGIHQMYPKMRGRANKVSKLWQVLVTPTLLKQAIISWHELTQGH